MKRMLIILTFSFGSLFFLNVGMASSEFIDFEQFKTNFVSNEFSTIDDPQYLTIGSVEMMEAEEGSIQKQLTTSDNKGLGEIILAVDNLIALGKKIWAIVEAGKPVVNTSFSSISVLPNLADPNTAFLSMANWSMPTTKKYDVILKKNLYGMEVVRFSFMIMFQHDGTFENKGKYLTGVNIIPTNITVAWGFRFDCKSELLVISNAGTTEDPIATATIKLEYITKTSLQESRSNVIYHIIGDGRIVQL